MAAWNQGKVVGQKQWNSNLYSLYVEADIEPYQAGQFARIGLEIDGEIVGRPYSLVNPPGNRPLEFYYIQVPNGPLTSKLIQFKPGDSILVAPRANGFMVLDEVPKARDLWLIATGTGVGPFLSILATEQPWQRFERVTLVYAVRTLSELSYQERIHEIQALHPTQFRFVPIVSREATDFALSGRIPQRFADGTLEARVGAKVTVQDSQIMLCGNPQMVEDTMALLVERGLKKHKRKNPGQITVESYW
ncbi:MAG TPA: ferredoxin--NADP reductase [Methylophilaceae bacterium]|jgi:ferredoxin--NADP+ reductase